MGLIISAVRVFGSKASVLAKVPSSHESHEAAPYERLAWSGSVFQVSRAGPRCHPPLCLIVRRGGVQVGEPALRRPRES